MENMQEKEIAELERLLEKLCLESNIIEFEAKLQQVTPKDQQMVKGKMPTVELTNMLQELKGEQLLKGIVAFPGMIVGKARNVQESKLDLMVRIHRGEIIVGHRFEPWHNIFLQSASALITDTGGKTSNAAILARQLNIPAVVGTLEGTTVLKDGQKVIVDGTEGSVYACKE